MRVQTDVMEPRGWWTVGLTALAGPVGAVAGAFVVYTLGGASMGLAAGVGGLILGGPLLAVVVFGICLLTLLKDWGLKGRLALSLMVAAALLDLGGVARGRGLPRNRIKNRLPPWEQPS